MNSVGLEICTHSFQAKENTVQEKGRAAAELGTSELSLAESVTLLSTDGTQDKISLKQ